MGEYPSRHCLVMRPDQAVHFQWRRGWLATQEAGAGPPPVLISRHSLVVPSGEDYHLRSYRSIPLQHSTCALPIQAWCAWRDPLPGWHSIRGQYVPLLVIPPLSRSAPDRSTPEGVRFPLQPPPDPQTQ